MNNTLYEITNEIREITNLIEEDDTFLKDEEEKAIQGQLQVLLTEKSAGVIAYIRSRESLIAEIKAEEKRLKEYRQSLEGNADKFKGYVKRCLEQAELTKVETSLGVIRLQKAPVSCKVINEELIPNQYKKVVISETVNKADIIKVFKETGEIVEGVEIEPFNYSLIIK